MTRVIIMLNCGSQVVAYYTHRDNAKAFVKWWHEISQKALDDGTLCNFMLHDKEYEWSVLARHVIGMYVPREDENEQRRIEASAKLAEAQATIAWAMKDCHEDHDKGEDWRKGGDAE